MKKKKKKYFHELTEKYRDGTGRAECRHFGSCGGCLFQDISYDNQLLLKKEYINSMMEGIASIDQVFPSKPFLYRNRMDIVAAFGKIGLRESGSYKRVVDIESCSIMQEKSNSLLKEILPLAREIEDYDYLRHTGYLRYIVFREAMFTGETMVNFVTASMDNRLSGVISSIRDKADSISILFNPGLADMSFGGIIEEAKRGYIEESFDGLKFRITPNSFFQSNSWTALEMYRRIKEETEGNVLDLYSGVGAISLFVAGKAGHVTGIESVPEAVETAVLNREINGIKNADFTCRDVKEHMSLNEEHYDTLILDPPRGGMNPKIFRHILEAAPDRIIYMSCNPAVFKNDLPGLNGYKLEKFEAYDMFPQTPHVETLALLMKV